MGTLRHYENRGLLKPEYTDPETGYRYYGIRQLEVLNTIRRLVEEQKESLIFLGKVGVGISKEKLLGGEYDRYDQVFLILDEEDDYEGEPEKIPAQTCAVVRFRGSAR